NRKRRRGRLKTGACARWHATARLPQRITSWRSEMESRSGAVATGPSPITNKRLGRGLESLTGNSVPFNERVIPASGDSREVPIDRVRRSELNPRKNFAEKELKELAESIRERGLVQPLIVRPLKSAPGHYEIVAGERRWRAAQLASQRTVPVI